MKNKKVGQKVSTSSEPIEDTSPYVYQRDKIKFELKIRELPWIPKQREIIDLFLDKKTKILFLKGCAGTSKAQPLDANILTPTGWVKMGDICVGSHVYAKNGKPTRVLGVYPQGEKDIYKVSFSDGTSTECTGDHLWLTKTYYDRSFERTKAVVHNSIISRGLAPLKHSIDRELSAEYGTVKSTTDIANTLKVGKGNNINHSIPIAESIDFPAVTHIIHPYVMGVLLGDGCLRTGVHVAVADSPILERIKELIPDTMKLMYSGAQYDYRLVGNNSDNIFLQEIRRLGLAGKFSYEKSVPSEYLFDSIENRTELLRGLMDSDGSISTHQHAIFFCSTSSQLMNDVRFIVESLSGVCSKGCTHKGNSYTHNNEKRYGRVSYTFSINMYVNPFFLERKRALVQQRKKYLPIRYITDIKVVSTKPAQCILVEDAEHLYITNNCIVTHNTTLAMYCGLRLLNARKLSDLVLVRSAVESSDSKMGYLPGDIADKFNVYLTPFNDKFQELLSATEISKLEKDARITMCPINFARGLNFAARFVCCDEAQNLSKKELHLLTSRIAEYSKVIICGDPDQSDLPAGKSGFSEVYDLFNTPEAREHGIYCEELTEEHIVRSELCKYITTKFKELNLKYDAHKNHKHEKVVMPVPIPVWPVTEVWKPGQVESTPIAMISDLCFLNENK